jgi:hypothetical protein
LKTDAALNARRSLGTIAALKVSRFKKPAKLGALQPKTSLDQTACDLKSSRDFKTAALLKLSASKSRAILSRCTLMPHIPRRL